MDFIDIGRDLYNQIFYFFAITSTPTISDFYFRLELIERRTWNEFEIQDVIIKETRDCAGIFAAAKIIYFVVRYNDYVDIF